MNRFKTKYFEPIEKLIEQDWLQGEGFTILTVQCSLIEAFATLRTGQIYTHSRQAAAAKKYYYFESKRIFTEFLKSEAIFENIFWAADATQANGKAKTAPFNADSFYSDVRCGLIHEARTKGQWIINADTSSVADQTKKIFIVQDGHKFKIYRTILHYRLKSYLEQYGEELRDPKNTKLRKYFARKMDHLFGIAGSPNVFQWWVDN